MGNPLTEQLKSIFVTKENLAQKEGKLFFKDYSPYLINRCLAKHQDTFYYAYILNQQSDIPKDEHYEFLLHSIRPAKRFAKLTKPEINPDVELMKKHYKYNDTRAREALKILTDVQINTIRELYQHE